MGNNTSTKNKKIEKKQEIDGSLTNEEKLNTPERVTNFQPISHNQRAVTFDERAISSKSIVSLGVNHEFRPLKRAVTFDTRKSGFKKGNALSTVKDVLHRRYFNARPQRDLVSKPGLYSISENIEDTRTQKQAVIVVDPFSTGIVLARQIMDRGYLCLCLFSDTITVMKHLIGHIPKEIQNAFVATIYHEASDVAEEETKKFEKTLAEIAKLNLNIIACLAGAETGVEMSDRVSERLHLVSNGTSGSEARRNKYLMGEKVRSSGLRAVKQCSATTWADIVNFIDNDLKPEPFEVIVKPVKSAGSDDVTLCKSMEEVKNAFGKIQGKINGLGLVNTSTLVQEYLRGTEYVVDTVSHDGHHKVVAVWEYDKRKCNGAPFVYFGVILRAASGPIITPIVNYILKVLDALEIVHGPAHAEVKFVNGEPCLVEIGSRCHGGEGSYVGLVNECIGYSQVKVAIDSYLDVAAFNSYPERPKSLNRHGLEKMIVCYEKGIIMSAPGVNIMRNLPSFFFFNLHADPGVEISPTVDMFTTPGSVYLLHDDEDQVRKDYELVVELEKKGMFELDPCVTLQKKMVVALVDPFSTGANLAQSLVKRGYDCICLYSDTLSNIEKVTSLVPDNVTLEFVETICYEGTVEKTAIALRKIIEFRNAILIGILPGAETGVLLADQLVDRFGLRGNDISLSSARRNKFEMGETLRLAGIRSILQTKATIWNEAETFIKNLNPSPFRVVLKPLESGGTDDVKLCMSMEDAKKTFDDINGKVNGLGLRNTAVLVQEYLEGIEYVIDTVSRDGVHKIVAIWQYDKRPVNNSAFVYFSLKILPANPLVKEIIDYILKVLPTLGIQNGPAHSEVKMCNGLPVLVETGARCHGGEGNWIPIASACVGNNQVDATVDAYFNPDQFNKMPNMPLQLLKYGYEAMLVSYKNGIIDKIPGLDIVKSFSSFYKAELFVKPGDKMHQTVDCFTTPGSIILIHDQEDELENHLKRIRQLEHEGFFILRD